MIRATVNSTSYFYWLYRAFPSLAARDIINLISVLAIWWCPCVESLLVLWEEGCLLWPVCSLGISNFLEEISSLFHSIVFLYFCALITEKGFLIYPCYSLELCIQWIYLSFSPFPLASPLFSAICKTSLDSHFAFLYFFSWGWSWSLPPVQCQKPPSYFFRQSIRSNPLNLFFTSTA